MTAQKTPAAYELKQIIARTNGRPFWRGDRLGVLVSSPVYVFPDQEQFDSDDVEAAAKGVLFGEMNLPHETVIFEVIQEGQPISQASHVVFLDRTDSGVEGFFLQYMRGAQKWTDVLAHGKFQAGGLSDVEINPKVSRDRWDPYASCLSGIAWRALGILSLRPEIEQESVPRLRRRKLARDGVTGWTWRIAHINVEAVARAAQSARDTSGGTHASPRWHIRRGHWRTLADGRRVFVREAQVGDPAQGGVVKDYIVSGERHTAQGE